MPIWKLKGGYKSPGANMSIYFTDMQALDYTSVMPRKILASDASLALRYTGSAITSSNTANGVELTGGRITAFELSFNGSLLMSVTGLDLSAKALDVAANSGDPETLARFMLSGRDKITATAEQDFLFGFAGADTLIGGGGDDYLLGGSSADSLYGGAGDDIITGGTTRPDETGNDLIYGGGGKDILQAHAGNDTVFGGDGNDYFVGHDGKDVLNGDDGNDEMSGEGGDDRMFGGRGDDQGDLGVGNDAFYGGVGNDSCFGRAGADSMFGDAGNDRLDGLDGNDNLYGGVGDDIVAGFQANDIVVGGAGNDTLIGGTGSDRFVFDNALGAGNIDLLLDFVINEDKIVLDRDVFSALGSIGALDAGKLRIGTNAADSSDRIIYNPTTGDLFYDRDGSGGAGKIKFAILQPSLALEGADFSVIG
jgi:Ca2+-binding RTX toxin-like protein